jgi:hypothetical protein
VKSIRTVLAVAGIVLAAPAFAQNTLDSLQMARAQISSDRKVIVANLMDFTSKESEAFWPVYNNYRTDVSKIDDKLVALVQQADTALDSLTEKSCQSLMEQWMSLKAEKANLRKSYVKQFAKTIPPIKLFRYYQLENKMDAVVEYTMAANVPLVE